MEEQELMFLGESTTRVSNSEYEDSVPNQAEVKQQDNQDNE